MYADGRRSEATRDVHTRLRSEFGGWVHEPTSNDLVDGVRPAVVLRPPTAELAAKAVEVCHALGFALGPRGNGTHQHVGNVPARLDAVIATSALTDVVRHDAADMTATVQAGVTLEKLQSTLGQAGQWLPLDPPRPSHVTAGGLIAADLNGGLRFAHGRIRDYLLGVRFVSGEGKLVRGGGQVVKNVAGYDLPKLLIGSFGTLGLVVEATLKVRPRPPVDVTLASAASDLARAFASVSALAQAPLAPYALDVIGAAVAEHAGLPPHPSVVIRLAGEQAEVDEQRRCIAGYLAEIEEVGAEACGRLRDFALDGPGVVGCRLAVPPSHLAHVCSRVNEEAERAGARVLLQAHTGSGVARVRVEGPESFAPLPLLQWIRFLAGQLDGFCIFEQLPVPLKQEVDVWGPVPAPLALLRSVKRALDPAAIFSPGRFCGGI